MTSMPDPDHRFDLAQPGDPDAPRFGWRELASMLALTALVLTSAAARRVLEAVRGARRLR